MVDIAVLTFTIQTQETMSCKKLILPALMLFFIIACNSSEKNDTASKRKDGFSEKATTKEDSLLKEVIEGHDVGMARMLKISRYKDRIKAELDSIGKLPTKSDNKAYQQTLKDLKEDLEYAEYSMNEWMDKFELDTLKDKTELRIKYLEDEKMKVSKVKENILNSLAIADSLFQKK